MTTPRVIILSGPSGVGKSSIIRGVLERREDIRLSVSTTTRPRREGEEEGRDYHFVDVKAFEQEIASDAFLEWARNYDNYYGTLTSEIEGILASGCHALLDIDTQGAIGIQENFQGAVYVFIMPPSMEILEARLRGRGSESGQVLKKRIDRAAREISLNGRYDHIVVNREVDEAVWEIIGIITRAGGEAVAFTRRAPAPGMDSGAAMADISDNLSVKVSDRATRHALEHFDQEALVQTLESGLRNALRAELENLIRERLQYILQDHLLEIVEETYWEASHEEG